ncbi:probable inactive shikimate kinase like 2, chloroplastic, partial [Camellia sinensis]|uniref:probable inactive shikimate kinase like 2, chloroplastic n=1 Tax=Camellia sinensis TaxID=4442 RepID=UPI001036BB9F
HVSFLKDVAATQQPEHLPHRLKMLQFLDGPTKVQLRLELGGHDIQSSRDIFVDAEESSLTIRVQHSGSLKTLMETICLYMDDDQLVVNLKKQDPNLKWPDIIKSWKSLTVGVMQLLSRPKPALININQRSGLLHITALEKDKSILLSWDSSEINEKIARKLAVGSGYCLSFFAIQRTQNCLWIYLSDEIILSMFPVMLFLFAATAVL